MDMKPGGKVQLNGPVGSFENVLSLGFLVKGDNGKLPNVTLNLEYALVGAAKPSSPKPYCLSCGFVL